MTATTPSSSYHFSFKLLIVLLLAVVCLYSSNTHLPVETITGGTHFDQRQVVRRRAAQEEIIRNDTATTKDALLSVKEPRPPETADSPAVATSIALNTTVNHTSTTTAEPTSSNGNVHSEADNVSSYLLPPPPNSSIPPIPLNRSDRFPSVELRVKVLMSDWYVPPCTNYTKGKMMYRFLQDNPPNRHVVVQVSADRSLNGEPARTYEFQQHVLVDTGFVLDRETTLNCSRHDKTEKTLHTKAYCNDADWSLYPSFDRLRKATPAYSRMPIIAQFGDGRKCRIYKDINLPFLRKYRMAATRQEIEKVTSLECLSEPRKTFLPNSDHFQPIVWKFQSQKHFRMNVNRVEDEDTPWKDKLPKAVFHGALTGGYGVSYKGMTDYQICMALPRCKLVYENANNKLLDAGLSTTLDKIPDKLNGISLVSGRVSLEQQLQYKIIIMIEGNDVSTGFKWVLLSQSVLMMRRPKYTSWAVEDLLEPWIHYVPIADDVSDVQDKIQWVLENDSYARRIAERGSLWIQDLLYHEDSVKDDEQVHDETLRRYFAHYVAVPEEAEEGVQEK